MIKEVSLSLLHTLSKDIDKIEPFSEGMWFWREIVKRDLLRFLEFAIDQTLVDTAKTLLFAYTYPGTMEGLIRLSQGLFGNQSIIIIDDSTPAVVEIEIKNANVEFLYALAQKNYTLSAEEKFALATTDLGRVVNYDPLQFFRNFMTPGRVLKNLTITRAVCQ